MSINWLFILIILFLFLVLDAAILLATVLTKVLSMKEYRKKTAIEILIRRSIMNNKLELPGEIKEKDKLSYFLEWHRVNEDFEVSTSLLEELLVLGESWNLSEKIGDLLLSPFFKKRVMGMNLIRFLDVDKKLKYLRGAVNREKSMVLRLKIIRILCEENTIEAVDYIRESLAGKTEFFKLKVLGLLEENPSLLVHWADKNRSLEEANAVRILIRAAGTRLRDWHDDFVRTMAEHPDEIISREASVLLLERFSDEQSLEYLMQSGKIDLVREASYYYCRDLALPDSERQAALFRDSRTHSHAVSGLVERIQKNPRLITEFFKRYQDSETVEERKGYAAVLSSRVQYFIRRLEGEEGPEIRELLSDMVAQELGSPIINFLNTNKNPALEELLLETIEPLMMQYSVFLGMCRIYLKDRLRLKLNLPPADEDEGTAKIQLSRLDRFFMVVLMAFTVAVPLGIFLMKKADVLPYMTGRQTFVSFLLMYNYIFAFYSIAINSLTLFLMFQSWLEIRTQRTAWSSAEKEFLFAKGILPSVTVLAPAYNEEETIVQNVYSLLSLNYPNLELIIINDGSRDRTFRNLVEQFDLRLVDYPLKNVLPTATVRGVYKNDQIPNLMVIDKKNGGKADSLNTGLNAAGGEYICSIDADSLLEPEALTKMMFQTLNSPVKTVAIGGNIIPVNGCITKNGGIREIHLPRNKFSRYQTIEYLRSFIAGRLGWTRLRSLLIISGAFGAFLRKDLLDLGGYMTGSGSMKMDTVGEDMELVVRLIRHHSESGEPFRVDYSHNANCWTEVPENLEDLLKQRDRWHRGLIEILLYHKKILFNKTYGAAGLLAFPYYFFFEFLGPFWEVYGYIVLLLSLLFGLLSTPTIVLMFTIVLLYGILVSSTALLLAEKDVLYFKGREFRQSIITAVKENFGYRQMISMHRVFSFVAYLFRDKGWQKLKRKGFTHE